MAHRLRSVHVGMEYMMPREKVEARSTNVDWSSLMGVRTLLHSGFGAQCSIGFGPALNEEPAAAGGLYPAGYDSSNVRRMIALGKRFAAV